MEPQRVSVWLPIDSSVCQACSTSPETR